MLRPTSSDDSGDVPDLVSTTQSMPLTSGTEAQMPHRERNDPSLGQLVSDTDDKEIQMDTSLGVGRSSEVLPGALTAAGDEEDESMRSARHTSLSLGLLACFCRSLCAVQYSMCFCVLVEVRLSSVSWCRSVLDLNHQCLLLGVESSLVGEVRNISQPCVDVFVVHLSFVLAVRRLRLQVQSRCH